MIWKSCGSNNSARDGQDGDPLVIWVRRPEMTNHAASWPVINGNIWRLVFLSVFLLFVFGAELVVVLMDQDEVDRD